MGTFNGTPGNDVLIGTGDDDILNGFAGADTLSGLGGNDMLVGGDGAANTLIGGTGNDRYYVSAVGDSVVELAGEGTDQVRTALASFTLKANVEELVYTGIGAFTGVGNDLANLIIGGIGNDSLDGGLGSDILAGGEGNDMLVGGAGAANTLIGGTGNDRYYVSAVGDSVVELAGEGTDQVRTALASFTLKANVEELVYTGIGAFTGVGNDLANLIIGGIGNDSLDGGLGSDILAGGEGNDMLVGGAGAANTLIGGTGNDRYYVSAVGDSVVELAGEGTDQVRTALASFTLKANVEELVYTGIGAFTGVGNDLANLIIGGIGNDSLDGGLGSDILAGGEGNDMLVGGAGAANTLIGGTGNDRYYVSAVGDSVVELAGEGTDQVRTALASFTLKANVEELVYTGIGAFTGVGNDLANLIIGGIGNDSLDGGAGADSLLGGAGNDALSGGEGADLIQGGAGNDTLTGGIGADRYLFNTPLNATTNVDQITDFAVLEDRILLDGSAGSPFAVLASGVLGAGRLRFGSTAVDADDLLLFELGTGRLYFDPDGVGGAAAVQIAVLHSVGSELSAANFVVLGAPNSLPTFTSGVTASVPENSPIGTVIYQAAATDADGDSVFFELAGPDAASFIMDPTGAVRAQVPLDYETRTSYQIVLRAFDSGGTRVDRTVNISILDVSDNPTTPAINEVAGDNNSVGAAQLINRGVFQIAPNANLDNDDLPSATILGSISPTTDVDFYSIDLSAGELLVLDIDATTGGLDAVVRAYDSNGTELGFVDDAPQDPGSAPHPNVAGATLDSFLYFRATTAGTYRFSVESYGPGIEEGPGTGDTSGGYSLNVSVGPSATQAQLIEEDIQALISGSEWPTTSLSYGFPTLASQYPASMNEPDNNFETFNATQRTVVTTQLQMIANVTALTFQQNIVDPGNTHLRYAMSDEAAVAFAYYPGFTTGGVGGTAWFNNSGGDFDNPVRGGYAWMGILHETGHALGLKHGHELPAVSPDRDSLEYTVMTYRSYSGDDINGYMNETWGYPQTLMMYDIAALQRIYGANFTHNSGNSIYTWSPTTGEMSINGLGQGAPGGNRVFMTLWDGGGIDTIDLSNYTDHVRVDLRPGEWSRTGLVQRANLGGFEIATGNIANALLYEGDSRSLIENGIGGSGNDFLFANEAVNHMTGNGGIDRFMWTAASQSGTGAAGDVITDFQSGVDKIHLGGVDANNSNSLDNDSFNFIGPAAFSVQAGELRYQIEGNDVRVQGDLNGDGISDFEIVVNNNTFLVSNDFSF